MVRICTVRLLPARVDLDFVCDFICIQSPYFKHMVFPIYTSPRLAGQKSILQDDNLRLCQKLVLTRRKDIKVGS